MLESVQYWELSSISSFNSVISIGDCNYIQDIEVNNSDLRNRYTLTTTPLKIIDINKTFQWLHIAFNGGLGQPIANWAKHMEFHSAGGNQVSAPGGKRDHRLLDQGRVIAPAPRAH